MDIQVAFNNISAAVRAYRGTADEHDTLAKNMENILQLCTYALAAQAAEKEAAEKEAAAAKAAENETAAVVLTEEKTE